MIKWIKRKQPVLDTLSTPSNSEAKEPASSEHEEKMDPVDDSKLSVYGRIKRGLTKTRQHFGEGIERLLRGKKSLDAGLIDDLETLLLSADVGIETSKTILNTLEIELARNQLLDGDIVFTELKNRLESILTKNSHPLSLKTSNGGPFVILTVGVNGAGKTTTIGKLAKQYQQQGLKVMLAAGDTFRAAAVQQLQVWGERNQIPVIAQHSGADSASVTYDALQAAIARQMDVLIVDTAGRLHTQHNLMEELKKVKRVLQKLDEHAPHETLLVLDAGIGQNALNQARQFNQTLGVSGIVMTKLDGTGKGGILFAIANELGIPFRYLGVGEGIDDLRPFDAKQFVRALFNND